MTEKPAAGYISNNVRTEGEVKQALEDIIAFFGQLIGGGVITTIPLTAGSATPTQGIHALDTGGGAANLDNIVTDNLPVSSLLMLTTSDGAQPVTVRHQQGGAGDITTRDGGSIILDATNKWVILIRVGADWEELTRWLDVPLTFADGVLFSENNLSDLDDAAIARLNLELGEAAVEDVQDTGSGDLLRADGDGAGLSNVLKVTGNRITFAINTNIIADHAGSVLVGTDGTPRTLTLQLHATHATPVGFQFAVLQQGAGQVTIAPEGGVTLNIPTGFVAKIKAQNSWVVVWKDATNTWYITGDLEAA
jgi:hypothetical protein